VAKWAELVGLEKKVVSGLCHTSGSFHIFQPNPLLPSANKILV
jgi:hypothetical protein